MGRGLGKCHICDGLGQQHDKNCMYYDVVKAGIVPKAIDGPNKPVTVWGQKVLTSSEYGRFTMPLIRRMFPALIANEIVSVQPMEVPTVGLSLRMPSVSVSRDINGEYRVELLEED